MPRWARLKTTSDAPLRDRMSSALENGYGNEGPLARVLAIGGCFGALLTISLLVIGFTGGVSYFLWLIGHRFF